MKAIFNNQIIAESDQTISFEGNTYFPKDSIIKKYFKKVKQVLFVMKKGLLIIITFRLLINFGMKQLGVTLKLLITLKR
jgi:hypothetical protein